MQPDHVQISLILSPDDPDLTSETVQSEFAKFSKSLEAIDVNTSSMSFAFDAVDGGGGLVGEYIIPLAKIVVKPLAVVLVAWFNGRSKRKASLKVGNVEIEIRTNNPADDLLRIVNELKQNPRTGPMLTVERAKAIGLQTIHSISLGDDIVKYFRSEVDNSEFIKKEARDFVLAHLLGRINILKTGNDLTTHEKEDLGLNPRRSITKETVAVLNEDGLKLDNPKAVFSEMWNRAHHRKTRHDNIEQSRRLGVKFTLMSCGDGNDCDWCKANQNIEFSISEDTEAFLSKDCTCDPYCKCSLYPIVDFEKFGEA